MIDNYKEGKKAGKFFAKSIERTGKFMSDEDAMKIASQYPEEYKQGFMTGWNDYWKGPLMKSF